MARFSGTVPGAYALSYKTSANQVQHVRVQYIPGTGYIIANETFQSMLDVVKRYAVWMHKPVTGGKYAKIFERFSAILVDYSYAFVLKIMYVLISFLGNILRFQQILFKIPFCIVIIKS